MVIAYVVVAIIGILAGIFVFFLGMSLFSIYIKDAKNDLEKQNEVNAQNEAVESDEFFEDGKEEENPVQDLEGIKRREKMFTNLPLLMVLEGAVLFIVNVTMLVLKFKLKNFIEFYVLLPIGIGIVFISLLIDALAMTKHVTPESEDEGRETTEKTDAIDVDSESETTNTDAENAE